MNKIATVLLACISQLVFAQQRPASDQVETGKGPLVIQPVFHGALILSWNNKTIYVDPYGGPNAYIGITKPDIVLITDIHPDHLDPQTLEALPLEEALLIVPQAVADKLPEHLKKNVVVLENNKSTSQQGVSFAAVPMYNLPESPDSKHTKGRGNGYVFNLGGKMIYISGDTEDTPEMRGLKNIDIAFVCMNLPYTMDVKQAASAVLEFRPKIVYPYHYRGKDGLSDVAEFKKLVDAGKKKIDVRLRNWYPVY